MIGVVDRNASCNPLLGLVAPAVHGKVAQHRRATARQVEDRVGSCRAELSRTIAVASQNDVGTHFERLRHLVGAKGYVHHRPRRTGRGQCRGNVAILDFDHRRRAAGGVAGNDSGPGIEDASRRSGRHCPSALCPVLPPVVYGGVVPLLKVLPAPQSPPGLRRVAFGHRHTSVAALVLDARAQQAERSNAAEAVAGAHRIDDCFTLGGPGLAAFPIGIAEHVLA